MQKNCNKPQTIILIVGGFSIKKLQIRPILNGAVAKRGVPGRARHTVAGWGRKPERHGLGMARAMPGMSGGPPHPFATSRAVFF